MVAIERTYSKGRRFIRSVVALVLFVGGFIAVVLSPKTEKMILGSLIKGDSVAHADFTSSSTSSTSSSCGDCSGPGCACGSCG